MTHFTQARMVAAAAFAVAVAAGVYAQEGNRPQLAPNFKAEPEVFTPLLPSMQQYAAIDGKHLKAYVDELGVMARKSKAGGNQYWGRIVGTPAHAEAMAWMEAKLRAAGLEIKKQEIVVAKDWYPRAWEVTATGAGKTVKLTTAGPIMDSPGTPAAGVDMEAVWLGAGLTPDFVGKDVKGKAAVFYSVVVPGLHSVQWTGGMRRAQQAGAGAIVVIFAVPGNPVGIVRPEGLAPRGTSSAPLLTIGSQDGMALVEMFEKAPAGQAPKMHIRLDVQARENIKSTMLLATLPGQSDEHVIVNAHADSYFEGAQDNASGMATLLGLAEYYAKIPKDRRRRSMMFTVTPEHHSGSYGMTWFHDNMKPLLAKTALIINCEHTATSPLVYWNPNAVALNKTNGREEPRLFAFGSPRMKSIVTKGLAAFDVSTWMEPLASSSGDLIHVQFDAPSMHVIGRGIYFHTDMDTADLVPASGLEGVTRAYAKIIDDVNATDLKDLVAPGPAHTTATAAH